MTAKLRKLFGTPNATEAEGERLARSFWLQFAAKRFPEIKNAAELIGVAEQIHLWHWRGDRPALPEIE